MISYWTKGRFACEARCDLNLKNRMNLRIHTKEGTNEWMRHLTAGLLIHTLEFVSRTPTIPVQLAIRGRQKVECHSIILIKLVLRLYIKIQKFFKIIADFDEIYSRIQCSIKEKCSEIKDVLM